MTLSSSSLSLKRDPDCDSPKHDVFLNYSFQDIGNGFVSHLKGALEREGFTISDHTMVPPGEDTRSEVTKAIQESEIYVPVFSSGYASSVSCLDELLDIMDCLPRFKKRKLLPVFYNFQPSDVRKQLDSFKEAFEFHQTTVDPHRIQKWKQALEVAGQLSGLCLQNGDEEKFIRKVLKDLRKMQNLKQMFLHVMCPVGVDSRADDIISALRLNDRVFNIVAVLGISGSGKSTIVKAVYDRIAADFEYTCFIEDVYSYKDSWGQRWKFKLQKDVISRLTRNAKSAIIGTHTDGAEKIRKLITGRKVLMVLDGVDKFERLVALGIDHASSFSCLSRIIVTTTNKESLIELPYTPYNMRLMDTKESFELFVGLTFGKDDPVDQEFVKQVVWCVGGLPLVLDVWSRYFKCYEREHWRSMLEKLKRIPHKDIQSKLQLSYDSLDSIAKKLFLDIACFFYGMKKDLVVKVLLDDDSVFFPAFEIQGLVNKGLLKINEFNRLSLHQAIKEMGQEVVRQENENESGQRSRMMGWDAIRVLEDCSGTELVESILHESYKGLTEVEVEVQVEALRKMRNLRLIKLNASDLTWLCDSSFDEMRPLCLKKLRYMEWRRFPFKSLDTIEMANVVVLRLRQSRLEILWEGLKSLKKLRILDVSYSISLTRTGNFIGLDNLQKLDLHTCRHLEEMHGSISQLTELRKINLNSCDKLESIPNLPPSIEEIRVTDCTSLVNLPSNMSMLQRLSHIGLRGCAKLELIPNLPQSIKGIIALGCTSLVNLPSNMSELQCLKWINLQGCAKLESIPNLPPSIEEIRATGCTSLVNLPSSMSELKRLTRIDLHGCAKLESIPNLPPSIEAIIAINCRSLVNLPSNMSVLQRLSQIGLHGCAKLESIPNLPQSIKGIIARDCTSLVNLSSNMSELQRLTQIDLHGCAKLESIPNLPPSIEEIRAIDCTSLVNLPSNMSVLQRRWFAW